MICVDYRFTIQVLSEFTKRLHKCSWKGEQKKERKKSGNFRVNLDYFATFINIALVSILLRSSCRIFREGRSVGALTAPIKNSLNLLETAALLPPRHGEKKPV